MTITELREKSLKIAHEARDLIPTIAADGNNAKEVEDQFDRMMAESDALAARADRLEAVEKRERDFASIQNVRDESVTVEARAGKTAEERADALFYDYLRGNITPQEMRAQSVGTNSEGGFTVPTDLAANTIFRMKAFGPLNEGGPVTYLNTAGGNPLAFPAMDDTANIGSLIAEGAQVSDQSVAYSQLTIGAYKYTSGVFKISSELLADSSQDIADHVTTAMATRLGRIANQHLTVGTGTSQPQGIVTAATSGKTAASATAVAFSELIDLEHSVDPAYRGNAGYMFNDMTFAALRKLVDTQNRPLWAASYQVGAPDTFNGKKFWINQSMANMTTGQKSILFGDFSSYTVRRAGSLIIKRLDERYADYDQVGFVAFIRLDGKLLQPAGIRALTQA